MTPVHQFTQLIEHADEEMRIVHYKQQGMSVAFDSYGLARYALFNNRVFIVEGITQRGTQITSITLMPYDGDEKGHTVQF